MDMLPVDADSSEQLRLGTERVSVLTTCAQGFLRAAATLAHDGDPDIHSVLRLAEHHGIEMLGPIQHVDAAS